MGVGEGEDLVMNDAQDSGLSNWTANGTILQENETAIGEEPK